MEQQSANMSMTRSTFDLTRALLDTLEKGSSVTRAVSGILQWLAREGIDHAEYMYCMERAAGLTVPNENGLQLRQKIIDSDRRIQKVAGLKLVTSGAVGRSLALDPAYCYMVSTVAALMAYHEYKYAVDALCEMILDCGGHEAGVRGSYSIHKIRLKPVLSKIVESIALNVVNAGHDLGGLPPDLAALCTHPTEPQTFAAVVMAVQRHEADSLICCGRLQADILMWLMGHYEGTIEVSIAGNIMFDKPMGSSKKTLVMLVRERCSPDIDCRTVPSGISVSLSMGGKLSVVLRTTSKTGLGSLPTTRQPLYSVNVDRRGVLNHSETNDIRLIAQAMTDWLLKVPLRSTRSEIGFAFESVLAEPDSSPYTVGSILKRWPSITHSYFGTKPETLSIYSPRRRELDNVDEDEPADMFEVIACFPIAMDLMERLRSRCTCDQCGKLPVGREKLPVSRGKVGCLRVSAAAELAALLAHAISEGFGAPDVSGMVDYYSLQSNVSLLFLEIINLHTVDWDRWFGVAAWVYLGRMGRVPIYGGDEKSEGCTAAAAFQYGSLVAVAPWVDLSAGLSQSDSFGFEAAEGQLVGVQSEFAVVQMEAMMAVADGACQDPIPSNRTLTADASDAYLDTAIIGDEPKDGAYRLLTMVKSDSFRRIVNPMDAIMGIYNSSIPQCPHRAGNGTQVADLKSVYVWTFDDILGRWDNEDDPSGPEICITTMLDTLKSNVAMSLTGQGCFVRDSNCCLRCALKEVDKHPGDRCRRVINRSSDRSLAVVR